MKRNMVKLVALGIAASVLLGTGMAEASDREGHVSTSDVETCLEYEVYTTFLIFMITPVPIESCSPELLSTGYNHTYDKTLIENQLWHNPVLAR